MLKRIHDKRNGLKKTEDSKKRWRSKIKGEDYDDSSDDEPDSPPRTVSPLVHDDPRKA
jgi:hypothetical protein